MPTITLFTLGSYEIGLFDFIPATHGLLALQQVLIAGAGIAEVVFRVAAMTGLSLLYFVAGVVIFERMQMRARAST
jgi:ABC-2 type transport system permease protein